MFIYVINLFVLFGRPPSMMDAILATIFDGVRAIRRKQSSSRIKLIKRLFYRFILNQAKVFLPNPFRRGCSRAHMLGLK